MPSPTLVRLHRGTIIRVPGHHSPGHARPPSGSPAKIPDFRRTCRLKFEPRRRRRRPTPCNSTLPTCWGRQRSAATKIVRLLRSAAAAPGVPGLAAAGRHIKARTRSPLSRLARNRQPRKALPAISMPEDPGPVLGKSRRQRHAHGQGLQHASVSTPSNKSLCISRAASVRVQRQPA